jgi:hypothetical protein
MIATMAMNSNASKSDMRYMCMTSCFSVFGSGPPKKGNYEHFKNAPSSSPPRGTQVSPDGWFEVIGSKGTEYAAQIDAAAASGSAGPAQDGRVL